MKTVIVDGVTLELLELQRSCEPVEITDLTGRAVPDPSWAHIDSAGHFHAWSQGGGLPTLERCPHACEDKECSGGFEEYRCAICHQGVEPGMIMTPPDMHRRFAPGLESWSLVVRAPVWNLSGDRVSVRGEAWFGVAVVTQVSTACGVYEVHLQGVSELGRLAE